MRPGGELRLLIHLSNERADVPVRELVDAVAEELFVRRQGAEGRGRRRRREGHGADVTSLARAVAWV